jgi:hypothetical protein
MRSVLDRTDRCATKEHAPVLARGITTTPAAATPRGAFTMLYTIAVILLILWALGLVSGTTVGGFVHVLLVIAVIVILLRVISGRRVL